MVLRFSKTLQGRIAAVLLGGAAIGPKTADAASYLWELGGNVLARPLGYVVGNAATVHFEGEDEARNNFNQLVCALDTEKMDRTAQEWISVLKSRILKEPDKEAGESVKEGVKRANGVTEEKIVIWQQILADARGHIQAVSTFYALCDQRAEKEKQQQKTLEVDKKLYGETDLQRMIQESLQKLTRSQSERRQAESLLYNRYPYQCTGSLGARAYGWVARRVERVVRDGALSRAPLELTLSPYASTEFVEVFHALVVQRRITATQIPAGSGPAAGAPPPSGSGATSLASSPPSGATPPMGSRTSGQSGLAVPAESGRAASSPANAAAPAPAAPPPTTLGPTTLGTSSETGGSGSVAASTGSQPSSAGDDSGDEEEATEGLGLTVEAITAGSGMNSSATAAPATALPAAPDTPSAAPIAASAASEDLVGGSVNTAAATGGVQQKKKKKKK